MGAVHVNRYWGLLVCVLLVVSAQPSTAGIYLRISDTGGLSLSNRPTDEGYRLIAGSQSREEITQTDQAVEVAAGKYRIPQSLLFAIIRNNKQNKGGLLGLPESVRSTMSDTAVQDLQKNALAGAKFLSEMLVEFEGNLMLTLGAFRVGEETIKENDGLPNSQVRSWVKDVRASFATFEDRDEIIYSYRNENGVTTVVNIKP